MATETLATGPNDTNANPAPAGSTPNPQPNADPNAPPVADPNAQTDEQKAAADAAAKAEAEKATAAKAEEDRRAKLTPEQRAAEDKAKADAEERRKANFGAPEKYEFKVPEGVEGVAVDAEIATELEAIAKEFDLSQAAAQRLHDLGVKSQAKSMKAIQEQVEQTRKDWQTQSKTDKEFGGDQLDANLAVARKAMELGTPELKQLLNDTGLGDHPEIIRWMHRVGKTLKQDEHVTGQRSTPGRTAQSYYPNSNMNP